MLHPLQSVTEAYQVGSLLLNLLQHMQAMSRRAHTCGQTHSQSSSGAVIPVGCDAFRLSMKQGGKDGYLTSGICLMQRDIRHLSHAKGIRHLSHAKGIRHLSHAKGHQASVSCKGASGICPMQRNIRHLSRAKGRWHSMSRVLGQMMGSTAF